MRVIRQVGLLKKRGKNSLFLDLLLCESGTGHYLVKTRQTLLDRSVLEGILTLQPVSFSDAERMLQKTIEQRLREGYQLAPIVSATPVRSSFRILSPEEQKARRRSRSENRALQRLNRFLSLAGKDTEPFLGKVIHQVASLQLQKAGPSLIQIVQNPKIRQATRVAAVWALGHCKVHAAIPALETLLDKQTPEPLYRSAVEVKLALLEAGERESFRASLRGRLPDSLRNFTPHGDVEAFQSVLSEYLAPETQQVHAVVDLLYWISDPVSRPALLNYARNIPLKPPTFQIVRHLFKAAEFRRDAEMFGVLAYRFETTKASYQAPDHETAWELESKRLGQKAYGSRTRTYLRRRVWRTLRRLGQYESENFIPMAVGVLLAYSDKDAQRSRNWATYDYKNGTWANTSYEPFSSYYSLNKLLFQKSQRFTVVNRLYHRERFSGASKLPRELYEEAFSALWRARPEGLLHLLDESHCALVHEFAALTLADCREFCDQIDLELIKVLLSKPYEITAKLGYDLIKRRYDTEAPDLQLLLLLALCAYKPAREESLRLLKKASTLLSQDTRVLADLLLAPYPEVQQFAGESMRESRLQETSWKVLLGRVVAGLLALGSEEDTRANRIRSILIGLPRIPLGELSDTIVNDLLAHPLAAVKSLGGDILFLRKSLPTDDVIQGLLAIPQEVEQAMAIRLIGRLPDYELLQKPLLIARLLAHSQQELRDFGLQLVRRISFANPSFSEQLCSRLIDALLRNKLPQGASEWIEKILLEDLWSSVQSLSPEQVIRLLRSKNRQAQALGVALVLEHDLAGAIQVDDLVHVCNSESFTVRRVGRELIEKNIPLVRADLAGIIRVLDSPWDDTKIWGFSFFREHLLPEDFSMEILVSIHDSIRPDVQAFGREMILRHLREEDGPSFLLRLSEHPSNTAQSLVTEYLDPFASGNPDYIRGLIPYFQAVLAQVNRARSVKGQVLRFLHREAIRNEEVAREILPLLHRVTASITIETRALALDAIAEIQRVHPTIPPLLSKISPEVRHGIQLYLPW